MSSALSPPLLTVADINFLQNVLKDAGYSSHELTGTRVTPAGKLLIKSFQAGMEHPVDLQTELENHFGRYEMKTRVSSKALHPFAIPGLPHRDTTAT
ncbi:hypothetical protein [Rhizobium sp. BE258]|jgi:hypothetical protein|uniref:hypothetical protein n=1 Tax=Rhizobium sp. BE258 TaxID=2817722 RepID=UPI0028607CF7|nr:hypothetical protein [Rhizobium sp. BE258]MDR7145423.1 hypothetical protein [Rhizobium sp. BE258]